MQPWVTFAILPVFALFNAGVAIDASALRSLASPVPLGIIGGLVIGKPAGIGMASWVAVKAGLATLPEGVSWRHVVGTAWLAGIGFTMAFFISGLAFPGTDLESQAKLGHPARVVAGGCRRDRHPAHDATAGRADLSVNVLL